MSNVVSLDDRRPSYSGLAKCMQCKHEWQAVAPSMRAALECPACSLLRGVFKGMAFKEVPHWQCNCGCDIFCVTVHGYYCPMCGEWQTPS